MRDKIKGLLAAQGMINGHAGSGHFGSGYDGDLPLLKLEDDNTPSSSSSNEMPPTPTLSLVALRPLDPHESTILDYPPGMSL
jgi:hypothetical protein